MKRFAILLGLVSVCGPACAGCDPTDPNFLKKDPIFVGEVIDYQRVPLPPSEFGCATTMTENKSGPDKAQNSCDGFAPYNGHLTVQVVDALKGGNEGELTILVTGGAVNGIWRTMDFSPGERFIFGLVRNTTSDHDVDPSQRAPQYWISGFSTEARPSCFSSVVGASQANIDLLRENLNAVPFVHSTADDSLRELPGDEPGERGCWIKQRKGTEWKKVEIPCG